MLPKLVYAWKKRYGPRSFKGFIEKMALVQDMESWPQDQIREWQWTKVKALLTYVQDTIPYYQHLFADLKIQVDEIRSLEDFRHLPILTKEDIQDNFHELIGQSNQAVQNQTGGSTGQPTRFYGDTEYLEWAEVSRTWGFNLCGFKGGEKQVFLWGSDYDSKLNENFKGRLLNRIHNIDFINAFNITDQHLKRLAYELSKSKPDYIWGYASTLELLADQVIKDNIHLHLKGVQSTAGTLYPSLREKLEQAFGNIVYDRYGSREVSMIAHECSNHQGLHVFCPLNYVEIVNNKESEFGNIVITNLHNKAFPFIRYSIGDFSVPADDQCQCGRTFESLKRIVGRSVEIITSPSGKLIDGEFFTHLFYNITGVKQFQVIQSSRDILELKIVKTEHFKPDSVSFLEMAIKEHGDPGFNVRFEFVDYIPPLNSGKRSFVLSKVPVVLA